MALGVKFGNHELWFWRASHPTSALQSAHLLSKSASSTDLILGCWISRYDFMIAICHIPWWIFLGLSNKYWSNYTTTNANMILFQHVLKDGFLGSQLRTKWMIRWKIHSHDASIALLFQCGAWAAKCRLELSHIKIFIFSMLLLELFAMNFM